MNPNTARSWVPCPLVLPFLHCLKCADRAASTFFSPHNMMIWYEITWNYMYIWLCYKMYINNIYLYTFMIYIYTYIRMYAKPCCYICKPDKTSMFFFCHPPALGVPKQNTGVKSRSEPTGLPLADISWWITWISSSATMRERLIWLPWVKGNVYYTWKPINVSHSLWVSKYTSGLPRLDIFGKWKLKLVGLPEIKSKLRKKIMKINATKHTRTEPFQFLVACYAQVVVYEFMLSLSFLAIGRGFHP